MTRTIRDYVDDALNAMSKARRYLQNVSYEDFLKNDEKQDATVRVIEVIGEAVGNIPQQIQEKYPDVPWRDIIGMRNKIAHEYFGVDFETVWKVVKEDIPAVQPLFEKLKQDYIRENEE